MSSRLARSQWPAVIGVVLLELGLAGCGTAPPTPTPPSQPGAVVPKTSRPSEEEITGQPQTSKKPTEARPAVLTLRATGALIDPEGKSLDSKEEAEKFLREERARFKEPRTIFRAEKETEVPRVRNALLLYRKAGFREVELQEAGQTSKKGPILTLSEPAKIAKGIDDADPGTPSDEDLRLPEQMTVVVRANPTGSQAGQVRDIIFSTVGGETSFPRGQWREELPKKLRATIQGQEISNKSACVVQADNNLTYGAFLEVVEVCSSAGIQRIELAISRKGRGE